MRRFSLKPYCWLLLLAGLVTTLAGCGADGDILEPNTQRYTAFVSSLQDAEEDDVITIDVYRDSDCDDNGTADDPEPWTDVLADITVSVDEKAPGTCFAMSMHGFAYGAVILSFHGGLNWCLVPCDPPVKSFGPLATSLFCCAYGSGAASNRCVPPRSVRRQSL